jgi:hypothetical protein
VAEKDFIVKNGLTVKGTSTLEGTVNVTGTLSTGGAEFATQTWVTSAIDSAVATKDNTDEITEGSTNLYYTTARADSDAKNAISLTDAGGDGSFTYNAGTGVLTYTGPSASEVRAHLVGNTGITYDSAAGTIAITNTGVSAATYGSASQVPVFTVNAQGQIDSAGSVAVAGVATFGYNTGNGILTIGTADGGSYTATVDLQPFSTTNLVEGNNLYYTTVRADSDAKNALVGGTGITYTAATGQIDITNTAVTAATYGSVSQIPEITVNAQGQITGVVNRTIPAGYDQTNFDSDLATKTTDNLTEGSTNLYHTTARADSDAKNAIAVTDAGGDGSLAYNAGTGVITYTGPSASEVRAHISAGTGITVTSGAIAITSSGVVAGTYGSAAQVPVFTVNAQGQIDSAGTVSVAGVSSTAWDSSAGDFTINTADGGTFVTSITLDPYTTSTLAEGSNLYYTAARGDSAARSALVAVDAGGDGSFGYDSATGIFTYTGPSAAEVRAHTVAGTGITYDSASGVISIGQAVGVSDDVTFGNVSASNFIIAGTTTTVNATTLAVEDPLIQLAKANNSTDVVDIGFIGRYYAGGDVKRTGLFRDASDGNFYLFKDMIDSAHDSAVPPTTINRGATGFVASTLVANVTGALTGNADTATKLATTRAIEVSGAVTGTANFDGTGAINIVTTATSDPVITLGGDLSGSVTLTNLASGTLTATVGTLNQNTTGSAATLTTTRAIEVSGAVTGTANFDGSSAINIVTTATSDPTITLGGDLSGSVTLTNLTSGTLTATVGTLNQNTTGSAATLTTTRAIQVSGAVTGTANFDGSAAINIVTTNTADPTITLGGDLTGSVTLTNLASGTLTATVGTLNQNTTGSAATLTTTRAIQVSGAVTGTANFDGSSAINIVTTNTADPTITLAGDLTGSVTLTNLASGTLTATIAANSVALGTDTTGNYVGAGAVSGVGLSGSLAAEGGTFTVTSNATTANSPNTIVSRDGSGNFNAGTITASLTGNVSGSSGSTTGNAATATVLATARAINGVNFNGSAAITVTAAAGTLSGATLASGVTASSLTSVGTIATGTWQGSSISTTYTAAKVTAVNGVTGAVTAANLMTAIQTVDGASSALDADLLDGQHGAYYRINVYNNAGTLLN